MTIRTAQIHTPQNKAFIQAIDLLLQSAEQLYASTGGSRIQFVDGLVFVNKKMLRFENQSLNSILTLQELFQNIGLGGLCLRTPPTRTNILKLTKILSSKTKKI